MPDNKFYSNPDDLSIDTLLEETKMQIDAAPGEASSILHDDAMPRAAERRPSVSYDTQEYVPVQNVPQQPAQPDFMPDFGDAFADYGVYEQPAEPMEEYAQEDYEDELMTQDEDPKPKKPKRKTGKRIIPLFVKVLLYVVIVGVVAVGLGYGAWECVKDVLAFGRASDEVTLTVKEGDTVEDIAQLLHDKGVIKYPWLFEFYCDFTDSADKIEPNKDGESYTLYYNYDYHALIAGMRNEITRTEVRVMIPEGYTAAQIFALMEEKNVCTVEQLEDCAANYEFDYWFLEDVAYGEGNRLEGFLYPDTYDFYEEDDPERVLDKLLSNFNKKFGEEAKEKLDALNVKLEERWRNAGYDDAYVEDHLFTVRELMCVASMIEKEAAAYDEAGNISSVIYNRLCNPADYPFLNIDATVIYALGGTVDGALTYEDTQVDSPYNTYVVKGLPAGPICNPGLSSISAALYPKDTNYFYYALDTQTGYHHFSETYAEHNEFLEGQDYG